MKNNGITFQKVTHPMKTMRVKKKVNTRTIPFNTKQLGYLPSIFYSFIIDRIFRNMVLSSVTNIEMTKTPTHRPAIMATIMQNMAIPWWNSISVVNFPSPHINLINIISLQKKESEITKNISAAALVWSMQMELKAKVYPGMGHDK